MYTLRNSFLLFSFMLLSAFAMAQTTAWIDKKTVGDSVVFKAMMHNNSASILSLKYTLIVEKDGPDGKTKNSQQGAFKAVPKSTVPLSTAILNISPEDYYKVQLFIFQKDKLICADTLQQGIKPLPIAAAKQQKQNPKVPSSSDAIEIDGLIIDETRSKTARDFYELFYNKWTAPYQVKDYSITIKELPSRGRSARILIVVNDKEVFQRFLQPRMDIIERMVQQAIFLVNRHLDNRESIKKQMSHEDVKGSGIY